MKPDSNQSRLYLRMITGLNPEPHANCGTSHSYILQHAQEWGPRIHPKDVEEGDPRGCFLNAYKLAARNPGRFFYVEGFATAVIPTEHAWCVDRQGRVIDCTPYWEDGRDYFGVKFTMPTLHAIQRITQGYGALVHWEHWDEVRTVLLGPARPSRERLRHTAGQRRRRAKA